VSPPRSKQLRLWLLLLLFPIALALLDFGTRRARPATPAESVATEREAPTLPASPGVAPRARAPRPPRPAKGASNASGPVAPAASACAANARKACHDGDVWWFDGCGRATERVEACDGRPCLGVGCAPESPPANACGDVSGYGRCDGETASACVAGRPVRVDCAASGRRCATTREGVRCLERSPLDCAAADPATCDGDALRRCVDGRWENLDCGRRLGRCTESSGSARCSAIQAPRSSERPLERCNASDEDLDGRIDEEGACDAVPLVAFVPQARVPEDLDAQLERELAVLNRIYAPLSFAWVKTVLAPVATQVGPELLDELARMLSRSESRFRSSGGLDFYIPVLFVEAITSQPPTTGQGSLPNSTCGGVRISDRPAPPYGLVIVSEERMPDTLAHELGHYLGLCHTHEELAALGLEPGTVECEGSGDGICDTPWDPGPERCALLSGCGTACADPAAQPDVANVMSYYLPCRRGLSAQQLAVVERGLHLRRGWFHCLDASQCRCLPGEPGDCPTEMSCQPTEGDGSWLCRMDGPSLPGASCADASECSGGSVCLGVGAGSARVSRCVRACRAPDSHCACVDAGLPFQVCSEDL
jgi:hypothetical protein